MTYNQMNEDLTTTSLIPEFLKISLPITISGATLMGLTLHDWTYVFTIVYTALGIATLVKKHWLKPEDSPKDNWLKPEDKGDKKDESA